MQSNLPEDDGLIVMQRLKPDQFDVVLGSHSAKRNVVRTKSNWPASSIVICLALLAAIVFLITRLFHTSIPSPKPAPAAVIVNPVQTPVPALVSPAAELRTTEQVVYVAPKLDTAQQLPTKPLEGCLKEGNVIDRDVANCRFGGAQPTDYNAPRPQGMVSDRYLAQYKTAAAKPQPQAGNRYQVAGVFIREIDGRNRYEARYRIFNNHIETSSVCMNFMADSVEHRECRRAAVPYFKEMCSDWTKRLAKDKNEKNQLAQAQFCEAASSYAP